jgi:hypothetical protein
MKTFDEIYDAAEDRPAFSNGTEGDAWMSRWCYECTRDADESCQLISVAMIGRTPVEWVPDKPMSLGAQYRCTEFEPTESP